MNEFKIGDVAIAKCCINQFNILESKPLMMVEKVEGDNVHLIYYNYNEKRFDGITFNYQLLRKMK